MEISSAVELVQPGVEEGVLGVRLARRQKPDDSPMCSSEDDMAESADFAGKCCS